jgi:RNA polymerase-binding protein DksA
MDQVRRQLQTELAAAGARLRELGIAPGEEGQAPGADAPAASDIGDVAQMSEQRELEFVTRERLAERIERLTAALQRLDDGHYGLCERCGRHIPPERLRAIPDAPLCRDCQEEVERTAGLARPRSV